MNRIDQALCVGGPLHGLRRGCAWQKYRHATFGPYPLGYEQHTYQLRRNSKGGQYWSWSMVPHWPVAGFRKPKR